MRVDKFLSNLSYGSRNDIKKYIKEKRIKINDTICTNSADNINPNTDKVYFDDELVFFMVNFCIAFHKPNGYICSNVDELYPSILNLLPEGLVRLDLKICGRLDYDTEGLVILTDNGNYVHQIISPSKDVFKKYLVKTKYEIKNINKLEEKLELLDGRNKIYITENAKVELINSNECFITIKEGKFHQVKRMFEIIENEVIYLKRVSVGKYNLDIELGEYKIINLNEII